MTFRHLRFLLILVVLSSCDDEKKEKEILPLSFEKEFIKKQDPACKEGDPKCALISLEVVKAVGNPEVSAEINAALQQHLIEMIAAEEAPKVADLDELTNFFIEDYKQAVQDFSEEPAWEAFVNQNVFLEKDSIVSIGITAEIFTGGAHGYKTLHFLNFNPSTGEAYSKQDLYTPEFVDLVEEKFRKRHKIPDKENINSTGFWFENDEFHLPENVGFSEDKVILVYNSYEVAPYSAGDIYMEIPLKEARPFLRIQ